MSRGDSGKSVEEISPKEEGTSTFCGVGLAKQMGQVEEFVFCAPVMKHSSSTSMELSKLYVRGQGYHENVEESY